MGARGQGDDAGSSERAPLATGALLAVLSAIAFGVTIPWIQRFSSGVGAFAAAALLYGGAALASVGARGGHGAHDGHLPVPRAHLGRLLLVAVFGAFVAPTCLVWGLARTSAASAALLLNLEAVFTMLLAGAIHREPLGARVWGAVGLMALGGAILGARTHPIAGAGWGLLAIGGATVAWSLDNVLGRALSELDPRRVVLGKATLGALLSTVGALVHREAWPSAWAMVGLLVCGASGYGLSLRLYLRAQRVLGAARTGSIFALAPFVGALAAVALGDRRDLGALAIAGVAFLGAVWLHVTERHAHRHRHPALAHEHVHRHDDGHHPHRHDPPFVGEHAHPHVHELVEHEHPHGVDVHHRHRH